MPPPFITGCSSFDRQNNGISKTGGNSNVQKGINIPIAGIERLNAFSIGTVLSYNAIGLGRIPSKVWNACMIIKTNHELILHEFGSSRSGSNQIQWRVHGWIITTLTGQPVAAFYGSVNCSKKVIVAVLNEVFQNNNEQPENFPTDVQPVEVHITGAMHLDRAEWARQLVETRTATRTEIAMVKIRKMIVREEKRKAKFARNNMLAIIASATLEDELEATLDEYDDEPNF